jgi:Ca2+-binding RTX toxin-like protein
VLPGWADGPCLWDTAPRLASLADNGGPVRTRALEPDSPAADGASPAGVHCRGTDARGGPGNDRLLGGKGNDLLRGEEGHDRIDGGLNMDRCYGGTGDDRIVNRAR